MDLEAGVFGFGFGDFISFLGDFLTFLVSPVLMLAHSASEVAAFSLRGALAVLVGFCYLGSDFEGRHAAFATKDVFGAGGSLYFLMLKSFISTCLPACKRSSKV